jgi:hypothetical protein
MRFSEGTFVERLSLMPALAIVAIVIVLMSFEFRLGNHFDSPAAPDRAYVPRMIKSKRRQSEASQGQRPLIRNETNP